MKSVLAILVALIPFASAAQENVPSLLRMAAEQGVKQLGTGSETMFLYRIRTRGASGEKRSSSLRQQNSKLFRCNPQRVAACRYSLRCRSIWEMARP